MVSWSLNSAADFVVWATFVLTMAALAWSAVRYVQLERGKAKQVRFENFYRTLERVHNKDQSLILQRAAIFELRNFSEYKDLIVRLCQDRNSLFPDVQKIQEEFLLTLRFFKGETS